MLGNMSDSSKQQADEGRSAPQRFAVSHYRDEDFLAKGLRSYFLYRELGMAEATGGGMQAHVIRLLPPCTEDSRAWHFHDLEFQFLYVLKGWIKVELQGEGEHLMQAGSSWLQPPRIPHRVLDYSDDCEMLEIVLPADFETVSLDQA